MKNNRVGCDIRKNDIHRASNSRHLKSKKHFENMSKKRNISRKNPLKRVVKEDFEVSDIKVENLNFFTDGKIKIAIDITIDDHHSKNSNSIGTFF